MLQVRKTAFFVVPPKLEAEFMRSVINGYVEFVLDSDNQIDLITEVNVSDTIVCDLLSRVASLEIFEDEHRYTKLVEDSHEYDILQDAINSRWSEFTEDVVITLDNHQMCYYHSYTETFQNLPTKEVW